MPTGLARCCPIDHPGLLPGEAEEIALRFKALGDPTRVRIMNALLARGEPVCVCDIEAMFDLSQPTISHHLKVLRDSGLARVERRRTWRFYSADEDAVRQLGAALSLGER